jgi:hypothetical protein
MANRGKGVQEFRSSGVQEFRSSGVQEFRSSGVQEFRSSGVQDGRFPKITRKNASTACGRDLPNAIDSSLLNSGNSSNS